MHVVLETAAEFQRVVKVHNTIEEAKQTFQRMADYLEKIQDQTK